MSNADLAALAALALAVEKAEPPDSLRRRGAGALWWAVTRQNSIRDIRDDLGFSRHLTYDVSKSADRLLYELLGQLASDVPGAAVTARDTP